MAEKEAAEPETPPVQVSSKPPFTEATSLFMKATPLSAEATPLFLLNLAPETEAAPPFMEAVLTKKKQLWVAARAGGGRRLGQAGGGA